MKPENIVFINPFDNYESAENNWNKLKHKEKYGIGIAENKHFIIPLSAIKLITDFDERQ